MWSEMQWLNEPRDWSVDGGALRVVTDMKTDFWRETFYGFTRDDGHFCHRPMAGDFTAEVTLSGEYEALYDQCGLMVRVDERNWVKTGVEFTDGAMHVSTVVTRECSDWSIVSLRRSKGVLRLRLTRHGSALRVQHLDEQGNWQLSRLGYLDLPETVQVGVMCCSPERAGFVVMFSDFHIGAAISAQLHE